MVGGAGESARGNKRIGGGGEDFRLLAYSETGKRHYQKRFVLYGKFEEPWPNDSARKGITSPRLDEKKDGRAKTMV